MQNLNMDEREAEKTYEVLARTATANGIAPDRSIQNALDEATKADAARRTDLADYGPLREVLQEMKIKE